MKKWSRAEGGGNASGGGAPGNECQVVGGGKGMSIRFFLQGSRVKTNGENGEWMRKKLCYDTKLLAGDSELSLARSLLARWSPQCSSPELGTHPTNHQVRTNTQSGDLEKRFIQ